MQLAALGHKLFIGQREPQRKSEMQREWHNTRREEAKGKRIGLSHGKGRAVLEEPGDGLLRPFEAFL
ncbi:hypothetical protein EYF80_051402 [Liparis tanakae]|uniref:Uncharacterized protein n=1 Tax=Liparis tanakae TaxID=230148 RepID=A0A4Z2FB08_9TELE|nr:hypothetical protein EYF80_051402 [Liparis tanakae]